MSLASKKILVIDDTASIRMFLRISLQAHGAVFFESGTAMGGVDLCEKIQPDLVVLDLGLPDKDGLDILPEIKKLDSDNGESHVPKVIILSVRKEMSTKDKAFALGADAYLSKPFLMDDLIDLIESQLASPTA